jgi:RNA polymerase sigma-70 factor (ECF subfamily)
MIRVMEVEPAIGVRRRVPLLVVDEERRFEAIYREHAGAVTAYARRRLPGRADDVVAETFLVAWRRFDDVPADALPWLYGVARRVVADLRRSSRRQSAVTDRLAVEPRGEAHVVPDVDPELLAALGRIPERDRELLLLVYWEDLEPRRAARALGCSRATVATRLWRAHRRLKTELEHGEVGA